MKEKRKITTENMKSNNIPLSTFILQGSSTGIQLRWHITFNWTEKRSLLYGLVTFLHLEATQYCL